MAVLAPPPPDVAASRAMPSPCPSPAVSPPTIRHTPAHRPHAASRSKCSDTAKTQTVPPMPLSCPIHAAHPPRRQGQDCERPAFSLPTTARTYPRGTATRSAEARYHPLVAAACRGLHGVAGQVRSLTLDQRSRTVSPGSKLPLPRAAASRRTPEACPRPPTSGSAIASAAPHAVDAALRCRRHSLPLRRRDKGPRARDVRASAGRAAPAPANWCGSRSRLTNRRRRHSRGTAGRTGAIRPAAAR